MCANPGADAGARQKEVAMLRRGSLLAIARNTGNHKVSADRVAPEIDNLA